MLSGILTALLVLNVIVLIVLVTVFQHGNEGGIGSSLGGGNAAGFFGASGGANVIIRATWISGALFFILAMSLAWLKTHESFGVSKEIDALTPSAVTPSPSPSSSPDASPAPEGQSASPSPVGSSAAPGTTPAADAAASASPAPAESPKP